MPAVPRIDRIKPIFTAAKALNFGWRFTDFLQIPAYNGVSRYCQQLHRITERTVEPNYLAAVVDEFRRAASKEVFRIPIQRSFRHGLFVRNVKEISWQELALPYDEFDVLVPDINNEVLVEIGHGNDVEHLSTGSFSSTPFPVTGRIHGLNLRYMIPLICQRAGRTNSRAVNVWFLVDTGSPFTCLSSKSLEALIGMGNVTHTLYSLSIQDQTTKIECKVSKAHFTEVNILGADAMQYLELSIIVDWRKKNFKLVKQ